MKNIIEITIKKDVEIFELYKNFLSKHDFCYTTFTNKDNFVLAIRNFDKLIFAKRSIEIVNKKDAIRILLDDIIEFEMF